LGKRKGREADGGSPGKKRTRSESGKARGKTEEVKPETGTEWRRRIDAIERRLEEGFRRVIDEIRKRGSDEGSDEDGDGDEKVEE
jgi:hypothetical protein